MNWQAVESSQIAEVGYDAESRTLGVRFKPTGKSPASEYHYAGVPAPIHRAMISAPSVGSFFTVEVKKRPDLYPYTRMGEVMPPTAGNAESALTKVDKMTPEQIFVPGTMDPILAAIRDEVTRQAAVLDISTEPNRKALAALAFKVTKSKTFIEGQRKSLVAGEKKRLQAIDSEGRRIWDILEGIATEVRQPLTEWEQIDKDRVLSHEATLDMLSMAKTVPFGSSAADIQSVIAKVEAVDPATTEEYVLLTVQRKAEALRELAAALKTTQEVEAQKAENDRLRAESAERQSQETAIAAARIAREQAEKDAEAEKVRIVKEAEDRVALAERKAAQAVEEERARAAEAKEQEAAATAKREQNKKHVSKIHKEIRDALLTVSLDNVLDLDAIINAIDQGKIPHVSITY